MAQRKTGQRERDRKTVGEIKRQEKQKKFLGPKSGPMDPSLASIPLLHTGGEIEAQNSQPAASQAVSGGPEDGQEEAGPRRGPGC